MVKVEDNKPQAQTIIDELRSQVTSEEDQAYLDQEQHKLNTERGAAVADLGQGVTRLAVDHQGVVHDASAVEASVARGEEPSGTNTAGRLS